MGKIGPKEAQRQAMRLAGQAVSPSRQTLIDVSDGLHEALGNPPPGTIIKVRVPPSFHVPFIAEIEARILSDQRKARAAYMRDWRRKKLNK